MTDTVESLLAYCRENGRVCPMPTHWNALYWRLPERQERLPGYMPPLPLILAVWDASDDAKRDRVALHVKWAAEHGGLSEVSTFLRGLEEADWYHHGDF